MLKDYENKIYNNDKPLVIFDLDSTLFNVTFRSDKILKQFYIDFCDQYKNEIKHLKKFEVEHNDWGLESIIHRSNKKYSEQFLNQIYSYWKKHFFSNKYLTEDKPYPGAVNFVKSLFKNKISLMYLTGRPEPMMKEGTLASLKNSDFPYPNEESVKLFMKPNAKILDHSYKIRVISEIANCYDYILFFENEPVIINSVSKKKYSHIDFIFMNSVHSGIEQPPKNIYSLPMSFEVN